ncbi:DUF2550 family protein [Trueperella pecoris]|uniref:DUF2550 family protein n=1 Tax=Trueperella pecoris TaxID=2733571 RepID=A0A7M1QVQ7_9ACTO|nr:DUF2550 family protein [Trueperella pecoris]QOQ39236.1 DUF2550 family protein [Trueperella pecoris]QOR46130.1 DUF2550 family protein [Trueperella pecoris]
MIIALAFVVPYLLRIRYLLNHEASIQVSLRSTEGRWCNAIAILGPDTLDLFLTRSFSWLPSQRWNRQEMSFEAHRPRGGIRVVTIILPETSWRLASSPDEMSALLSWMDSSRPEAEPTIA